MKYIILFLYFSIVNCNSNITKLSSIDSKINIDVNRIIIKSDNYKFNLITDLKLKKQLNEFIKNNLIAIGNNKLLKIIINEASIKEIDNKNYKGNLSILFEIYENEYDLFPIYDSKFNADDIVKIDDHYSLSERNILIDNLIIKLTSLLKDDILNNLQIK